MSKKIDLSKYPEIPEKCYAYYNPEKKEYYVRQAIYRRDPAIGKIKLTWKNIGKIKDGVFIIGPSYALEKQIKELKEELARKNSQEKELSSTENKDSPETEESLKKIRIPL